MNARHASRLSALLLSLAPAAAAQAQPQYYPTDYPPGYPPPQRIVAEGAPRGDRWQGAAGVRTTFVRSAGYDPFSHNDMQTQFSLSITRLVVRDGALSFVAGAGLDAGGADDIARGAPTALSLTRWSALAEARYVPYPHTFLFGRLAPGLLHAHASLEDVSAPGYRELGDSFNALSIDTSLGAAVNVTGDRSKVGFWLLAEGGYGWSPAHHLLLAADVGDRDQPRVGATDLGTIAVRGAFMRFALALSY